MSKRPDDRRAATRRAIREMEEEDAALSRELEMEPPHGKRPNCGGIETT